MQMSNLEKDQWVLNEMHKKELISPLLAITNLSLKVNSFKIIRTMPILTPKIEPKFD